MRHEDQLQQAVATYLSHVLPPDAFWTAVDKAGKRSPLQGARLKARGLKSGIPDILVWHRGVGYGIELKAAKGQLTDSQRATIPAMERAGVQVAVCRTVVDVHAALERWAVPLSFHALDPATRDAMLAARAGQAPKRTARARALKPSRKAVDFARRAQLWGTGE